LELWYITTPEEGGDLFVYNVREYEEKNGNSPFHTWLSALDGSVRFRVQARINRVKYDGNFGQTRNLKEGVSEMKCTFGGGVRIYYGIEGKDVVVLLVGGNKSSQEKGDIERAISYWNDYKEYNDGEEI
jgi:putative addiction module killer protein